MVGKGRGFYGKPNPDAEVKRSHEVSAVPQSNLRPLPGRHSREYGPSPLARAVTEVCGPAETTSAPAGKPPRLCISERTTVGQSQRVPATTLRTAHMQTAVAMDDASKSAPNGPLRNLLPENKERPPPNAAAGDMKLNTGHVNNTRFLDNARKRHLYSGCEEDSKECLDAKCSGDYETFQDPNPKVQKFDPTSHLILSDCNLSRYQHLESDSPYDDARFHETCSKLMTNDATQLETPNKKIFNMSMNGGSSDFTEEAPKDNSATTKMDTLDKGTQEKNNLALTIPAPQDTGKKAKTLTNTFQKLTLAQPEPDYHVRKKDFCDLGTKIGLHANYFQLDVNCKVIYHYSVTIKRAGKEIVSTTNNKLRSLSLKSYRLYFEQVREKWSIFHGILPVYDGDKNCYTAKPLPIAGEVTREQEFVDSERRHAEMWTMSIKPVRKLDGCDIDLAPLSRYLRGEEKSVPREILTTIITVLRHGASSNFTPVYQGFYERPNEPAMLDGVLEVWPGFDFTVIPGYDHLFFNLNLSFKVFYPPWNLLEFIIKNGGERFLEIRNLKNLKIYTKHLGYKKNHLIYSLSNSANTESFEKDGCEITVADYFKTSYNIVLERPDLPLLNVGNKQRATFLPIELCYLQERQPYNKEFSINQQSQFIKHISVIPSRRFILIREKVVQFINLSMPYLNEFNMSLTIHSLSLHAQRLDPPILKYKNAFEYPKDGVWKTQPFYKAASLKHWIVISFSSRKFIGSFLNAFIKFLISTGISLGMAIAEPMEVYYYPDAKNPNLRQIFNDYSYKHQTLQLAMVILGPKTGKCNIKHVGDNVFQYPTMCIKEKNIKCKGDNMAFVSNICQKLNVKLKGVNFIIDAKTQDCHLNDYEGVTREQRAGCEIIEELKEMTKELLHAFVRKNPNVKPHRLLFFRDGVGEGQYAEVKRKELPLIQEACREVFGRVPATTLVIVLKRHNTRFAPQSPKWGVGRFHNIPPGTVADAEVTQRHLFEFFLCSHAGIQSTSIPIKYCVLHDENKLSSSELCYAVYCLCHLYMRCTRSISIPVIVQHAHHWALKGKEYFLADDDDEDEDEDFQST
ncbi:AGO2 [Cordylochernes scorpioides]|uniref:AGO2 n=1 Tax=Cordylochernes scorpioides TaxID=51811 RepID=A0ABY6K485_9ARAC|nr:AGO2 [Cordylochernes scorpioides]